MGLSWRTFRGCLATSTKASTALKGGLARRDKMLFQYKFGRQFAKAFNSKITKATTLGTLSVVRVGQSQCNIFKQRIKRI